MEIAATIKLVRWLIAGCWVLGASLVIIAAVFGESHASEASRKSLSPEIKFIDTTIFTFIALGLPLASIGVFFMRPWGRTLFALIAVIGIIPWPFEPQFSYGWVDYTSHVLMSVYLMITGAIVVLLYIPPISFLLKRRDQAILDR